MVLLAEIASFPPPKKKKQKQNKNKTKQKQNKTKFPNEVNLTVKETLASE